MSNTRSACAVSQARGSSQKCWKSRSTWNLEMLVFEERGKPEYLEKNLSEQGREPTTNSTHIRGRVRATLVGGERSHPYAIPAPPKIWIPSACFIRFKNTHEKVTQYWSVHVKHNAKECSTGAKSVTSWFKFWSERKKNSLEYDNHWD